MGAIIFVLTIAIALNIVGFGIVFMFIREAIKRNRQVREALSKLCANFGFDYQDHRGGEISISQTWGDRNKNPITREEFEEFARGRNEYTGLLEKHLGVKLEVKEIPGRVEKGFVKLSK